MRINVLMYHDVGGGGDRPSGFPGPGAARYHVEWSQFCEQLDALAEATAAPPQTAGRLLEGAVPSGSWALTFDDGGASAARAGAELARRGWRGHFLIATDLIGTRGFLDPEELRALHELGQVIGSHSSSHPERMRSLAWPQLLEEWRRSVAVLSEVLGEAVICASVPGGFSSTAVAHAADAAGIRVLFTSEPSTRVGAVGRCATVGRFPVRRHVDAATAAAVAAGRPGPWLRERALWGSRELFKRAAPGVYVRARGAVLAARSRQESTRRRAA